MLKPPAGFYGFSVLGFMKTTKAGPPNDTKEKAILLQLMLRVFNEVAT